MRAVMGIDTSAYTTSVAVVGRSGVLFEHREVLAVSPGMRGLRPSEALFRHLKNLPGLMARWQALRGEVELAGVAVSTRPRPEPDSYLPPFVAGEECARVMHHLLEVPLVLTSHQEGHIRAGLASAGREEWQRFAALHISGGTTELLAVEITGPGRMAVEVLGGSDDLYAGQFVDRVGVAIGLGFPAGMALEQVAAGAERAAALTVGPPRHRDGRWWISFSGPESQAARLLAAGAPAAEVARGVELAVAGGLSALIEAACRPGPVLVVGGVAANQTVRRKLEQALPAGAGWRLGFATPELSRDNAVGVAYIGLDQLEHGGHL